MSTKIIFNNVYYEYYNPHHEVFKNLSFDLDTSWKTAIVGRNGYGKTTLMQLIKGNLKPFSGTIIKPINTIYFPFIINNSGKKTIEIMKNLIAPFTEWEIEMQRLLENGDETSLLSYGELEEKYKFEGGYVIESTIEQELNLLEINQSLLQQPFYSLSEGEKVRIQIICLFLKKNIFPLLDEPTNHLDFESREKLAKYLSFKTGFLLISHDRNFLDLCADHILSINKADVRINNCRYSDWKKAIEDEEQFELNKQKKLKKDIVSLKQSAFEKRDWSDKKEQTKSKNISGNETIDKGYIGHKAAKLMKKAVIIENSINKKIDEKSLLLKNKEQNYKLKMEFNDKIPNNLITLNNISVSFDKNKIINNFSLKLNKGQRIALRGGNGSGKTTLFKVIIGEIIPDEGYVSIPGFVNIQYVRQNPTWNQKICLSEYIEEQGLDLNIFRQSLAILGVKGDVYSKKYNEFSAGEKKKIELAKSLINPITFLLWDEPLNFLDIQSREVVERAIIEYKPTMLFIEHDDCFVDKIATEFIAINNYSKSSTI